MAETFNANVYYHQGIEAYIIPLNGRAEAVIQNAHEQSDKEIALCLHALWHGKIPEKLENIKKIPKRMEYMGGQKHHYYDAAEIDFLLDQIINAIKTPPTPAKPEEK